MRCDPPGCPHVSRRLRRVSPRPPDLGPIRWFPRPASPGAYPGPCLRRDPPLPSSLPLPPGRDRGGARPLSVYPVSGGVHCPPIAQGFDPSTGPHPFTAEALGDFCVAVSPETLLAQQLAFRGHLQRRSPPVFRHGVSAMDCMTVAAPPGRLGLPAARFVRCLLSVPLGSVAVPIL